MAGQPKTKMDRFMSVCSIVVLASLVILLLLVFVGLAFVYTFGDFGGDSVVFFEFENTTALTVDVDLEVTQGDPFAHVVGQHMENWAGCCTVTNIAPGETGELNGFTYLTRDDNLPWKIAVAAVDSDGTVIYHRVFSRQELVDVGWTVPITDMR